jgi:hypothetical protein
MAGPNKFNPAIEELAKLPQWVVWREIAVKDRPKPVKMPVNPATGDQAKSNDPHTWGTFEQCAERSDRIGFVFSLTDPYGGVDLDCCRDPETGEIHQNAWDIIRRFNSYTEISPSKTGVKIFGRFALPPRSGKEAAWNWVDNRKVARVKGATTPQAEIAIFDQGRYFTVTGEHLEGTPWTIQDCEAAAHWLIAEKINPPDEKPKTPPSKPAAAPVVFIDGSLTDEEVLRRARRSKDGAKFNRLWAGDSSGYASQSEADFALLTSLAFWTRKDAGQMERLFRHSDAWTDEREKKKGKHYVEDSIRRSCEAQTTVYEGSKRERQRAAARDEKSQVQVTRSSDGDGPPPPPADPLETLNAIFHGEIEFKGAKWRGASIMVATDRGVITFDGSQQLGEWRTARNIICDATQVFLTLPVKQPQTYWEHAAKLIVEIARKDCEMLESTAAEDIFDILSMLYQRSGYKAPLDNEELFQCVKLCVEKPRDWAQDPPPCVFEFEGEIWVVLQTARNWCSASSLWGRDLPLERWRAGLHLLGFTTSVNPVTRRAEGRRVVFRAWRGPKKRFIRQIQDVDEES